MGDLKDSFNKIKKRNFSDENLKSYLFALKEKTFVLGSLRFLMDYYSNLLFLKEETISEDIKVFYRQFNGMVEEFFLNKGKNILDLREKMEKFRTEVIDSVEFFYSYNCAFDVFRYVIHRRHSLSERALPKDFDEETREILEFIFESGDNLITNIRIAEVVKELPIRFTKGKVVELVMEALDQYLGGDRLAFSHFVDRVRSSVSLKLKEDREYFKIHKEIFQSYLEEDYSQLEGDRAVTLAGKVLKDQEKGSLGLDACSHLVNAINGLYTMIFLFDEAYLSLIPKEIALIQSLIETYKQLSEFNREKEEAIDKEFVLFEEKIEELQGILFDVGDGLFLIEEGAEDRLSDLLLEEEFVRLKEVTLIRENPFLEIEELNLNRGSVEKEELERIKEEVKKELEEGLKVVKRPLRRGLMAAILGELPVFLKNRTEVMDYIKSALSTCENEEELREGLNAIYLMRRENDYNQ